MKSIILISIAFMFLYPAGLYAEEALSWQDCIKEAARNNPDLIQAAENVIEIKAGKAITASGLFPQVEGTADASKAKTTSTSSSGIKTSSTKDSYSYGLTGTQLLFDGFKTINDLNAASENVKAAQQSYRFVSADVRLALRSAFVNLLKAQELIRVAEEVVKIRQGSLELIRLRYESGLEHKGALLTSEANLAAAESELAQSKRELELAQMQLNKAMGSKEFMPVRVTGELIVGEPATGSPDFNEILKENPSVLEALFLKNAASFGVKSAYGDFAPSISGSAQASRKNQDWPPEDEQWDMGVSLRMPIFEGGLKIAQVSQATAVYKKAEAEERSVRDSTLVNLKQAWISLQYALETVGVRNKSLKASEERALIAESQYSTGFITFDDKIIIENDLVSAKKAYLESQANALQAEASWFYAKGDTLEYAQE